MTILEKLKNLRTQATASERRIIDYFFDDYPVNTMSNLQDIAAQTNCSIPTVQRMVVKLGFRGYPDFRREVLNSFRQEQDTSPLARIKEHSLHHDLSEPKTYQQTINNISETFHSLPKDILNKAAHILANTDYAICCLGGRFTGTLATLFARHLKTLRKRVREFTHYEGALADIYAETHTDTVLFVTDIRRYDKATINLCKAAKIKGATIILVTDNWLSPAEKYADIVIPVFTNSPSGWDSNACLLVVLEEIMSIVTDLLGEKGQHSLQMREQFLEDIE